MSRLSRSREDKICCCINCHESGNPQPLQKHWRCTIFQCSMPYNQACYNNSSDKQMRGCKCKFLCKRCNKKVADELRGLSPIFCKDCRVEENEEFFSQQKKKIRHPDIESRTDSIHEAIDGGSSDTHQTLPLHELEQSGLQQNCNVNDEKQELTGIKNLDDEVDNINQVQLCVEEVRHNVDEVQENEVDYDKQEQTNLVDGVNNNNEAQLYVNDICNDKQEFIIIDEVEQELLCGNKATIDIEQQQFEGVSELHENSKKRKVDDDDNVDEDESDDDVPSYNFSFNNLAGNIQSPGVIIEAVGGGQRTRNEKVFYLKQEYDRLSSWEEINQKLHSTFGYPDASGKITKTKEQVYDGIDGAENIIEVLKMIMHKDKFSDSSFLISIWCDRIADWVGSNEKRSAIYSNLPPEASRLVENAVETFHKSRSLQVNFLGEEYFLMQPSPIYSRHERKKFWKKGNHLYYQMFKHCTFDTTVIPSNNSLTRGDIVLTTFEPYVSCTDDEDIVILCIILRSKCQHPFISGFYYEFPSNEVKWSGASASGTNSLANVLEGRRLEFGKWPLCLPEKAQIRNSFHLKLENNPHDCRTTRDKKWYPELFDLKRSVKEGLDYPHILDEGGHLIRYAYKPEMTMSKCGTDALRFYKVQRWTSEDREKMLADRNKKTNIGPLSKSSATKQPTKEMITEQKSSATKPPRKEIAAQQKSSTTKLPKKEAAAQPKSSATKLPTKEAATKQKITPETIKPTKGVSQRRQPQTTKKNQESSSETKKGMNEEQVQVLLEGMQKQFQQEVSKVKMSFNDKEKTMTKELNELKRALKTAENNAKKAHLDAEDIKSKLQAKETSQVFSSPTPGPHSMFNDQAVKKKTRRALRKQQNRERDRLNQMDLVPTFETAQIPSTGSFPFATPQQVSSSSSVSLPSRSLNAFVSSQPFQSPTTFTPIMQSYPQAQLPLLHDCYNTYQNSINNIYAQSQLHALHREQNLRNDFMLQMLLSRHPNA